MEIKGSKGTPADVTSEGRLLSHAVTRTEKEDAILRGMGFTLVEDTVTPTGPADCFLYVGNDDIDAHILVIESLEMETTAAEDIYLKVGPTYATTGTSAAVDAAQNRLAGHANVFSDFGTAEAGVDITGQGASVEIARFESTALAKHEWNEDNAPVFPIMLGKGQSLSVFAGTGTTAITHVTAQSYWLSTPAIDG